MNFSHGWWELCIDILYSSTDISNTSLWWMLSQSSNVRPLSLHHHFLFLKDPVYSWQFSDPGVWNAERLPSYVHVPKTRCLYNVYHIWANENMTIQNTPFYTRIYSTHIPFRTGMVFDEPFYGSLCEEKTCTYQQWVCMKFTNILNSAIYWNCCKHASLHNSNEYVYHSHTSVPSGHINIHPAGQIQPTKYFDPDHQKKNPHKKHGHVIGYASS